MKPLIFICLTVISFIVTSQRLPYSEDYYGTINPSANFNQNSYAKLISYSGLQKDFKNFGTIAQYKHNFKQLSMGILGDGNYNSYFQKYSIGAQVGYKYVFRQKYALNTAIGTRFSADNYNFSLNMTKWNPLVLGLDAGLALESKRFVLGFHLRDFNQPQYWIDSLRFTKNTFVGFYASYRFKLDSLGKFELRPAIFYEQSLNSQQRMVNLDLSFKFHNHAVIIGTGFGANNVILGYNYHISRWSFGPSLNFDFNKLSNSSSVAIQFRLSYAFKYNKVNIRPPKIP